MFWMEARMAEGLHNEASLLVEELQLGGVSVLGMSEVQTGAASPSRARKRQNSAGILHEAYPGDIHVH